MNWILANNDNYHNLLINEIFHIKNQTYSISDDQDVKDLVKFITVYTEFTVITDMFYITILVYHS